MKKLLFVFLLLFPVFSIEAHLTNSTMSPVDLFYDRYLNDTSHSYKEPGIRNPNAYLAICNTSLNQSYFVDLRYASESGNLSFGILTFLPNVTFGNLTNSCKLIDIDLSAFKAVFPARPFLYILERIVNETNVTMPVQQGNNTTYKNVTIYNVTYKPILIYKLNETLNGSYNLGLTFDNVAGLMYVSVNGIYDESGSEIDAVDLPILFISIVYNNKSVEESVVRPKESATFNYTLKGSEMFYVNGLPSLKIKPFDPCGKINESGYYVLNRSAWNTNESCIVIENVSNVFLNFGNHTVDGDENKTLQADICGVTIRNAKNIILFDARVQSYKKNICILNSENVEIVGTYSSNSIESIYVFNSTSKVSSISLDSNGPELFLNDSFVEADKIMLKEQTKVSFKARDIAITDVPHPPPDRKGYINIKQFINVSLTKIGGWLYRITFHYTYPLPNNVTHVVYITKVDGEYVNGSWVNLSYTDYSVNKMDFTDASGKLAYGYAWIDLNFTNFSVFIPCGVNLTAPVPKPVPQPVPQPVPKPTEVPGPEEKAIPPKVNLTLHIKEITLQQGETGEVPFDIKNEGTIDVFDIYVDPEVRYGWKGPARYFEVLRVGARKDGKLYITVYDNEKPGEYFVPVRAKLGPNNVTVDVEMLKVIVIPRQRVAKLSILEILPYLVLPENSKVPISILVQNTGDYNLTNITLHIEGAEDCIEKITGTYNLSVGEKKPLSFTMYTKKAGATCKGIYVLNSNMGPVGVYPVIIKIRPVTPLKGMRVFPIIYIIWTMLTVRAIYRHRRRMKYGG